MLSDPTSLVRPQYSYVQLGCSKKAENIMLAYAQSLVGKPFSNVGMARSILYPRKTDGSSFFCAGITLALPNAPPLGTNYRSFQCLK